MTTQTVNQAARTAIEKTQFPKQDIESLHRQTMSLLDELDGEQSKVYAVASAGRAFVGKDAVNESCLFSVIGDLCEDITLTSTLRKLVTEMAARAGSTWEKGAAA